MSVLVRATKDALVRVEGHNGLRRLEIGDEVKVSTEVADRLFRAKAAELAAAANPEGTTGKPAEPVLIEVDGQEVDLSSVNDAGRLREIAKAAGLEIAGNVKKVDTIRAKIVEHLNAAAANPEGTTGDGEGGGDGNE